MLTFEDFFAKKKIDLALLREVKPDLYGEFKSHYEAMGERSFDHTKKYWFNKLRKDFLLKEEPKSAESIARTHQTPTTEGTSPESSAPKPAGFIPRFKTAAKPREEKTSPKSDNPAEAKPKPGFKPRFKPGVTKTESQATTHKPQATVDEHALKPDETAGKEAAKPSGFKPRFKPGMANLAEDKESGPTASGSPEDGRAKPTEAASSSENTKPVAPSRAFRPRFMAGKTAVIKPGDEESGAPKASQDTAPGASETPDGGYRPAPVKFKPSPGDESQHESNTPEVPIQGGGTSEYSPKPVKFKPKDKLDNVEKENNNLTEANPAEGAGSASKAVGFKPRFKPGMAKKPNADGGSSVDE